MSHVPSLYKRGSPFTREEEFVQYLNKPSNCPPVLPVQFQEWKSAGYVKPIAVEDGVSYYRDDAQVFTVEKIKELERLGFDTKFMQYFLPRFDRWYVSFYSVHQPRFFRDIWGARLRTPRKYTVYMGNLHRYLLEQLRRLIDARADFSGQDRITLELLEEGQCLIFELIDETDRCIKEKGNHMSDLQNYRQSLSWDLMVWLFIEKTLFTGCPKSRSHIIYLGDVFDNPENYEYAPSGRTITCNFTRAGKTCGFRFDFTDHPWRSLRWIEGRKQVCLECGMAFDLRMNRYRRMELCLRHQRQKEGGMELGLPVRAMWDGHMNRVVANLWYSPP